MKIGQFVLFLIYVTTVTCQEDCHCKFKADCPYNCNSQCDPGWLGTSCLTQCHCLDKADCPYNCNFHCVPGWLGTSCLTRNIALNRRAYQSSKGELCGTSCTSLPASLAVDGDTRTDRTTRCSATGDNQDIASLTVSFEHPQLIDRVGLYFPDQRTATEDRSDFQVWVGGTLCFQQSATDEVSNYTEISCEQQLLGTTVSVVLPAVSNKLRKLALCEIEIYECAELFSGNRCDKPCRNCTTFCDQRTEQCYNRDANIAIGHTSMFMPTQSGHFGTAAQVIDGNTADTNCPMVSGNNPWWEIQFTETRTINWMRIVWSSAFTPSNFIVLVGDYTCYSQVSSAPPPRQFTFSCPVPPQGDSVRILRQGVGLLQLMLCEVEIYECVDGFYGSNCRHRCNCRAGEICGKSTGNCFNHGTSTSSTPTISTSTRTTQATTTTIPTTTSTKLATTTTTSSESASSTLMSEATTSSTPAASETTTQTTTTTIPTTTSTKLATTATTSSESASSTLRSEATTLYTPAASETTTPKSATAAVDADGKANIAGSGSVKVFDVIESRFPASIQGDPSVTIDGDTSLASCVIINGIQPSWKVIFDKKHLIYGLTLFVPNSAFLTEFNVQVGGSVCYQWSSTVPVTTSYRLHCFEQMTGDSVIVYVPQSDSTASLALCEVEVYGTELDKKDVRVAAIVAPCVIAVVIAVVVVIVFVIRRKGNLCVKPKDDPVESHYAGLEPRTDDNYTTLTPPPDRNETGPYENEQVQLEGPHTYVNSVGDQE